MVILLVVPILHKLHVHVHVHVSRDAKKIMVILIY